jgi:Zn-dependent protease
MSGWWVTNTLESLGVAGLAAHVIWVIVAITLHELAHGWAAMRRGDPTPEASGHMTFNPVVHMGVPSLIVFALAGIAWGMMPVDSSRLRGRYAEAAVAFAGPAMNFLLALVCIILLGLLIALEPATGQPGLLPERVHDNLRLFFLLGGMLNVALGLFNLAPIPPLDGSRILANFSRPYREFIDTQVGGFLSFVGFALAFFFAGGLIFGVGAAVVFTGSSLVAVAARLAGIGP